MQNRGDGWLKKIRRLVFETSHLSPYLPLLAEQLPAKLQRITADSADPTPLDPSHPAPTNSLWNWLLHPRPCMHPCSTSLLVWYFFVGMAILYFFVQTGIMITYGLTAWQDELSSTGVLIWDGLMLLVLVSDMAVQFRVGYLFRGVVVLERTRVVSRYLHSFFLVDCLIVSLLLVNYITKAYWLNYPKLVMLIKFARIFQIDQFYLRRLGVQQTARILYVIGKQILTIYILSHSIGLIFYLIDFALLQDPICSGSNSSLCWLESATAYSPIISFSWPIQYFYTLYWGVNTICTISYGDIAPNNPQETLYAVFMFCFGFVVFGYVGNSIVQVVLWARNPKDEYRAELVVMMRYMQGLKVNPKAQEEMRDHLEFIHLKQIRNAPIEDEMKGRLPQQLKMQLLKTAYFYLHSALTHIFQNEAIAELLQHVEEKRFLANQTVLIQGQAVERILYLSRGAVKLHCMQGFTSHDIAKLSTFDECLGLYEYFLQERSHCNITTERGALLYLIPDEKIQQEVNTHSEIKQRLQLVRYQLRHVQDLKRILYKCYFCSSNHHWHLCDRQFPNFQNVSLKGHGEEVKAERILHKRGHTWKHINRMKELQRVTGRNSDEVLSKIERRLIRLKRMHQQEMKMLEVDSAHNWPLYLPDENLSRLKSEWNTKVRQKRMTYRLTQRLSKGLPQKLPERLSQFLAI